MRPCTTLALAILLGACGESTQPKIDSPAPCSAPIQVTSTSGSSPEFSWAPGCGINRLTVQHVSATVEPDPWMWTFSVPERTPVGPKIVYGQAPRGATVYVGPKPLIHGEVYRVTAEVVVGGDVVSASGWTQFSG